MKVFNMFITAVCVILLIKLRWPNTKSLYDKVFLSLVILLYSRVSWWSVGIVFTKMKVFFLKEKAKVVRYSIWSLLRHKKKTS